MSLLSSSFLAAERLLQTPGRSDLDFYRSVHDAASMLFPVDAFYICLVQREPDWLHFVYNCEGKVFAKPEPFPFGKGPTSWVARNGEPYVITQPDHAKGLEFVQFADAETVTGSAVHWPMWIHVSKSRLPDGVISFQAYTFGAYKEDEIAAIEWLALRTSDLMARRADVTLQNSKAQVIERSVVQNRAIADVKKFVSILDELSVYASSPRDLLHQIQNFQVELTRWAPNADKETDPLLKELSELSDRELEVIGSVVLGLSNKEVGKVLGLSEHTVKRHLDNIYHQTSIKSRSDIAKASQMIRMARLTRSGH